MKKASYLAMGIALGIGLSASGEALAAVTNSLIGKTVKSEFSVYVDNRKLPDKAPVVEGRSYLPVRKLAQITGMELTIRNDAIYLKTPVKEEINVNTEQTDKIPTDRPLTPEEILKYQQELLLLNQTLAQLEAQIRFSLQSLEAYSQKNDAYMMKFTVISIESFQKQIETLKARKAILETAIKLT
ncbi:MAG: hypothetical protein H7X86_00870 [Gorillibacterium sp.]|nr:hypothetical protein [Gorillibacterium sp.]